VSFKVVLYRSVISEQTDRQADRPTVGAGIVLIIDIEQSSNGMREINVCVCVCMTHIVAHFECTLHVLVHSVVVERHEERVDDDAQCDEQLDERIVDEEAD